MAGEVITVYTRSAATRILGCQRIDRGVGAGFGFHGRAMAAGHLTLLRERWEGDGRLVVFVPDQATVPQVTS